MPLLKLIAQELVKTIRNSVTIDWTEREAVRAQIRVAVKRILRRYGLPARQTREGHADGVEAS